MTAPSLGRRDVSEAVKRYFGADRRHFLIAFHGAGDEDQIADAAGGPVQVVPVSCELDLRRRLLDVSDEARVAFLVPWRGILPLDLQGRFARHGRIEAVGRQVRLRTLFGAAEVDEEVWQSPLPEYLLAQHGQEAFAAPGGRLTEAAMWCGFLQRAWGLETGGELALDVLLGFAATDGRGPALVAAMAERGGVAVRAALDAELRRRVGPAGPLVIKAWELGQGRAAVELAILAEAVDSTDREFATFAKMTGKEIFGAAIEQPALAALGAATGGALRYVDKKLGAGAVRNLIKSADERAASYVDASSLERSTRLGSAWRSRLATLGRALAAGAESPGAGAARAAIEAFRLLSSHEQFGDASHRRTLERAEMATRLAAWLALGPARDLTPSASSYGDVETLSGWYVSEGGFLDWARRAARGGDAEAHELGAGIAAVLRRVDEHRHELDRRFAKALPAWVAARRPADRCLPIDHVTKRVAARFLEEDESRRLLVVLMDGMAWAQAAEILASLGRDASPWGPLAWHGMAKHRLGEAPYPPVLAAFPTLTNVSRSAFFAGKAMASGPEHPTTKDPDRWRDNVDARRFTPPNDVPQLLLRAEGQARDGSASQAALSLIADDRRRVVALVINAIDASLGGDPAQRQEWTVDAVKSLRDVLDKAREVGRAVLLCADHGHVPGDRLEPSGGALKDGRRWRAFREGDTVADYEVVLRDGEGVWVPRGADGVVMLADDAHVYGGGVTAGEHGGATLAEVVAPCLLIGCEDSEGVGDDPGQAVRPMAVPAWWSFDVVADQPTVVEPPRPEKRSKKVSERQLPLLSSPTPVTPSGPTASPAAASGFAGSALLAARASTAARRARVVEAVEFLLARGGGCAAPAFAAAMREWPARIGGFVSTLQEVLNVDGYPVLRFDRQSQQIYLDREKLAQQFEVTL